MKNDTFILYSGICDWADNLYIFIYSHSLSKIAWKYINNFVYNMCSSILMILNCLILIIILFHLIFTPCVAGILRLAWLTLKKKFLKTRTLNYRIADWIDNYIFTFIIASILNKCYWLLTRRPNIIYLLNSTLCIFYYNKLFFFFLNNGCVK